MAEEAKKLERIPLLERAAEAFERCVQIREKVRGILESVYKKQILLAIAVRGKRGNTQVIFNVYVKPTVAVLPK